MTQREIKFRLILDDKIIGYEKWYSGKAPRNDDVTGAEARWLYSEDNKYWRPSTSYWYGLKRYQFTGLYDKNGKEIFEGDVLCSPKNPRWFSWLIKIIDGSVCLINIGVDGYLHEPIILTKSAASEREIIDNICEHPTIITQQK